MNNFIKIKNINKKYKKNNTIKVLNNISFNFESGKTYSIILSEKNAKSLFIPAGFAHGFCGLEKENIVVYGCTNYRSKKNESGILWNDSTIKINWPIKKPIVSKKDKSNISFKEFEKKFK